MKRSVFQRIQIWLIDLISKVKWKQRSQLTDEDLADLRKLLTKDYYVIATRRRYFLTSFFISLGHFFLTGRWGFFTHVLMNLEDEVKDDNDFRLIEANTHGTMYSTFDHVFGGADAVALLKPSSMTIDEWTLCMDKAMTELGKPYDNLFNLKSDQEINCVELVYIALSALPDFNTRFANFAALAKKYKKLTPQMFLECPDFHVVYFVKR